MSVLFFFFSSRRRHTRLVSDWSSDVCSSDLTIRMVGRTRVHLDEVERLGSFVELEVVLGDGEPAEDGVAEAHRLMAALGIRPSQLVSRAYVDLLRDAGVPAAPSGALRPKPGRTALLIVDMQRGFVEPGQPMEVPPAREIG